jgi:superfamily II DNA or RNA helicase
MDFTIKHNKTYVSDADDEEMNKLQKVLRIWYKDHMQNLLLFNLFEKKELAFPTGYLSTVLKKLKKRNVEPTLIDKRTYIGPIYSFSKKDKAVKEQKLWDHQVEALDAIDKNPTGIISAVTGAGKSKIIIETFHLKKVKTLIIVPSTTIQKQLYSDFCESIGKKHVSIKAPKLYKPPTQQYEEQKPKNKFGSGYVSSMYGDSKSATTKKKLGSGYLDDQEPFEKKEKKKFGSGYLDDVATPKEKDPEHDYLKRKLDPDKYKKWQKKQLEKKYKQYQKLTEFPVTILCFQGLSDIPAEFFETIQCVIVDESHHASAKTIREPLLQMSNAAYRYGFSATPWRDKFHEEMLLISALGDNKIFDFSALDAIEKGIIAKPVYTMLESPTPDRFLRDIRHWRTILEEGIIGNKTRNKAIVNRAVDMVHNNRNVLICVDEISHLEILKERLTKEGVIPFIIHGQMNDKEKDKNIASVSFGDGGMVSIATMAVGEGANLVNVDAVILAGGGKGSIRFLQRIGRGARKTATKFEVLVIDFHDWFNPTLAKHSRMRKQIFQEVYGK